MNYLKIIDEINNLYSQESNFKTDLLIYLEYLNLNGIDHRFSKTAIIEAVKNGMKNPYLSCGQALLLIIIQKQKTLFAEDIRQELSQFLIRKLQSYLEHNKGFISKDCDYITGKLGIIITLLKFDTDWVLKSDCLNNFLNWLDAALFDHSIFKVEGSQSDLIMYPEGHVRFGIAHGITSIILCLNLMIKKKYKVEENQWRLERLLQLITRKKKNMDEIHYWIPKKGDSDCSYDQIIHVNSWCYGALGNYYALIQGNKLLRLDTVPLYNELYSNLLLAKDKKAEPIICHGLGGDLIGLRLVGDNIDTSFLEKECQRKILELINQAIESGTIYFDFLEGVNSGIMAILSQLNPDDLITNIIFPDFI